MENKSDEYPCEGHDCYDRGNFHVGCEMCPLFGTANAAGQEGKSIHGD